MRICAITLLVCLGSFPAMPSDEDPLALSRKLRKDGDYRQAESVLRDALAQPSLSPSDRADVLNSLGDMMRVLDRPSEARPCFRKVLDLSGVSWQSRVGALMGVADLDRQAEAWQASADEWNEVLNTARSHGNTAYESLAVRGLGEMWLDHGDKARAEPLLKRALALIESDRSVPPHIVSAALDTLASLYRAENKTGMAEELWMRELQINRQFFGDYHPQTGLVMGHLAEAWSVDGDHERALDYSRQVTEIMTSHFEPNSSPVASALVNEAVIAERAHQLQTAAGLYAKAFGILQATRPAGNISESVAKLYAGVLSKLHRSREAKQVVQEAAGLRVP